MDTTLGTVLWYASGPLASFLGLGKCLFSIVCTNYVLFTVAQLISNPNQSHLPLIDPEELNWCV